MKRFLYFFAFASFLMGCENSNKNSDPKISQQETFPDATDQVNFGIVIHGGAGSIREKNMSDSTKIAYAEKLEEAIRTGHEILKNGGTAVDAVRETINVMENSPLFNSGKGAVFAHDGTNQLDASIMNGKTLKAGAVAGVTTIKNPIDLAYQVMINSPHVMLYGDGAEEFAKLQGVELVDPSYFYTEDSYKALQRVKTAEKKKYKTEKTVFYNARIKDYKPARPAGGYGTVGAVALDKNGNLAAGTSTGGMTNKRWNRIGDSPIIGAGTYANNKTCAISCTGWGEYFIRGVAAYDVSAMMEYGGKSLQEAAKTIIYEKLPSVGGGGLIGIDAKGNMVAEFNTPGMFRAMMDSNDTEPRVEMFVKE